MTFDKEELFASLQAELDQEIRLINQASHKIENDIKELKEKEKQVSDNKSSETGKVISS